MVYSGLNCHLSLSLKNEVAPVTKCRKALAAWLLLLFCGSLHRFSHEPRKAKLSRLEVLQFALLPLNHFFYA